MEAINNLVEVDFFIALDLKNTYELFEFLVVLKRMFYKLVLKL